MPETPQGLLFVFGECGAHVTEEEFNDWYDNEHAPARLTVKGFANALRFKAVDSQQPTWLALYELTTPEIVSSDGYKALGTNASRREFDIVSRLEMLDRRVYKHFSTHMYAPVQLPAKFLLVVSLEPSQEGEAEFNKWYEEEHMGLVSKIPGWLRGRRYTFSSQTELAGRADMSNKAAALSYLAIHDIERPDFMQLQEFQTSVSTPWAERVLNEIVLRRDLRVFELHKDFGLPKDQE